MIYILSTSVFSLATEFRSLIYKPTPLRVKTELKTPFQLLCGCADGMGDAICDDLVGKGPEMMEKMIGGSEKMRNFWRANYFLMLNHSSSGSLPCFLGVAT